MKTEVINLKKFVTAVNAYQFVAISNTCIKFRCTVNGRLNLENMLQIEGNDIVEIIDGRRFGIHTGCAELFPQMIESTKQ